MVFGNINLILVNYLNEKDDVYIPITKRITLYTEEFETKAMLCTFTYIRGEFQNMFLL